MKTLEKSTTYTYTASTRLDEKNPILKIIREIYIESYQFSYNSAPSETRAAYREALTDILSEVWTAEEVEAAIERWYEEAGDRHEAMIERSSENRE